MKYPMNAVAAMDVKVASRYEYMLQQVTSKMRPYCRIKSNARGKEYETSYLGTTEMEERLSRFEKVSPEELARYKRRCSPRAWHKEIHFSEDDYYNFAELNMSVSDVTAQLESAYQRSIDQTLLGVRREGDSYVPSIGGIFGETYGGEHGKDLYDIPAANHIDVGFRINESSTAKAKLLTFEKLLQAQSIIRKNHADDITNWCLAITSDDLRNLCSLEESKNKNYGFASLLSGNIVKPMGFNLLVTEYLPKDEAGNTLCPVWSPQYLELGVWENPKSKVCTPDEAIDEIMVKFKHACGAVRLQDEPFVIIHTATNI